ncbi:transcriptional regulator, AsnC family [Pseudopedobacter saltans DSM 12145]|uniref:Transcriptional regulator, AsnC family n=1 Tax=Pseudopedobacter saltans (strain ATCC 51119 / DSM 12145 / JCM 21818 / CCUG 39354 / LMG 10337 / NBRC 100064 / NCIMB 13643) TaxID=762903 RepID=F0SC33_PSESL|nr:Lrp/AsnC family transcriptional regulator [Pseudopedobacter saltans]ADY50618.1 transcriptional regulator, AsnC family [Pseudopedobacter saltans DSM 12145]
MEELDTTDTKILNLLQQNARLTNKQLALELQKSPTSIFERVRKLEEKKYIKRYVAILDAHRIERKLTAFTHVQLKEHSQTILMNFAKEVVKFHEVMECYHMTGAFDFFLKIAVKDMEAYHDFLMNKLSKLSDIGTLQSSFVMSEAKNETAYIL